MKKTKPTLFILIGFIGCFFEIVWILSCVTNQVTGSRSLNLIPDAVMDDLGAQSFAEISAKSKQSSDPRWNAVVKRAADRIAKSSAANFNWQFKLVESQEQNAFCLPGGKIMVYTGILAAAQNEAALAFVLGHEVGHAVAKHGAQRISQGLLAEGAMVALSETALRNNPDRALIMAGLGLGAQVGILLPYSRHHESEADHMGLIYMAKAGYDPREAPKFWQRMGGNGEKPPEFLSTHPSDERRQQALLARMKDAESLYAQSRTKYGIGDRLP